MTKRFGYDPGEVPSLSCRVSRNGEPETDVLVFTDGLREAVADLLAGGSPVESLRFSSREARHTEFALRTGG